MAEQEETQEDPVDAQLPGEKAKQDSGGSAGEKSETEDDKSESDDKDSESEDDDE